MAPTPRGVRYEWRPGQAVEYQLFPEEFFSGADVSIYFGDTWVDDIISIGFQMREVVQPIFGYASYTWDAVMRGKRMASGEFTIAFREAGYLSNLILDHIAQLNDPKPAVAYLMDKQMAVNQNSTLIPTWQAKARERIETLLARYHSPYNTTPNQMENRLVIPSWPDLKPGDALPGWVATELVEVLASTTDLSGQPYLKYTGQSLTKLEGELLDAVKRLQAERGLTDPPGYIGTVTKVALSQWKPVEVVKWSQTSLAGLPVNESGQAKTRQAAYEAEIWGLAGNEYQGIPLREMRRFRPHWYSGRYTQNLHQRGFDIYFSFGALDAQLAEADYKKTISNVSYQNYDQANRPGGITVPTTVKALRNVQLTDVQMVVDDSGNPVAERYSFIAQDVD